ncbi:MAG: site-specific integrase [Deltaproteobacteria bacterium]|nr:site-specific integrase [Deltaproteobacteria bacterium]
MAERKAGFALYCPEPPRRRSTADWVGRPLFVAAPPREANETAVERAAVPLDLVELVRRYIEEIASHRSPATVRQARVDLGSLVRWAEPRKLGPEDLSKRMLVDYLSDLRSAMTGRDGGPLSIATVRRYMQHALRLWNWAYDEAEELGIEVAAPRTVRLPEATQSPVRAPTWAEMDRAIALLREPLRTLAVILRCTGLRVSQGLRLEWRDLDLKRGLVTIRGELGKSTAERRGRIVPLAPVLRRFLAARYTACVREACGARFIVELAGERRTLGTREIKKAWRRAGVPEELWKGQSWHAFRKGLETALIASGAHPQAVEVLLGHKFAGQLANYVDPRKLPLEHAVSLVPPLTLAAAAAFASPGSPVPAGELELVDAGDGTLALIEVPRER